MIRVLCRDRNPPGDIVCAVRCHDFMQGPGRFRQPRTPRFGDIDGPRDNSRCRRTLEGPGHEIDDRDCRRRTAGLLHQRHQRGLRRRRQDGQKRRRPELLLQRPGRTHRPRRVAPRSAGNAAENLSPIIAATGCCRRCEPKRKRPPAQAASHIGLPAPCLFFLSHGSGNARACTPSWCRRRRYGRIPISR